MLPPCDPVSYTLADLHQSASVILSANPDPILAHRLLREVLHVPPNDPALERAAVAARSSFWVRQLDDSQLPDGSWGRFHTQDTKKKTLFRTTEEAIDRAFALGLDPGEGALKRVIIYCQQVLAGAAHITDRSENHPAFPLLIKYIVAGRLAQIDPADVILLPYWNFLLDIADQAFASGSYSLQAEEDAFLHRSGVHVPGGFLESQHSLWILSARQLPLQLEQAFVSWIWNNPDGIRYIRTPLSRPDPRRIGYWLRSMNILSRFRAWKELAADTLNKLWGQRDELGLWDFSSHVARSVEFPLSESWRQGIKRKQDCSTHILVLLRKYFD